jgi:hypothetical protein
MSGRSHSQRRWTHSDLVVLRTLVKSGETLGSLASRLGRPRGVVMLKCAELMLPFAST